jgi:SH3-like domain-containing protein
MTNRNKYFLIIIIFFFSINVFSSENTYFLSLKNNKVNLRHGPSFDHPIKFVYKKKYLPVIITDKSESWRKIKDLQNNSGWIHISQLSKNKSAINIKNNSIIYKNPTTFSRPLVKLENGRLVLIIKCKEKWCKIKSASYSGWIEKKFLWGEV